MSQQEIINLFEKSKKPLSCVEISAILNKSYQGIIRAISKMIKYNEIKRRKPTKEEIKKYKLENKHNIAWNFYIYELNNKKRNRKKIKKERETRIF